jgi:hypothetical protein
VYLNVIKLSHFYVILIRGKRSDVKIEKATSCGGIDGVGDGGDREIERVKLD